LPDNGGVFVDDLHVHREIVDRADHQDVGLADGVYLLGTPQHAGGRDHGVTVSAAVVEHLPYPCRRRLRQVDDGRATSARRWRWR
jgi:hypothetical protein